MFPTSAAVAAVTANSAVSQQQQNQHQQHQNAHQQQGAQVLFGGHQNEALKELKGEIINRQMQMAMMNNVNLMPSESEMLETLPERVHDYTDLYPLKRSTLIGGKSNLVSNVFGFVTSIYKAIDITDNQTVCLRRVHSYQPHGANQKSFLWLMENLKKIQCPTMVRLIEVFTTKEFGDTSMVFVYQYFPQCTTLMQQYFSDPHGAGLGGNPNSIYGFSATNRPYSQQHAILKNRLMPENLLWHYIIQISSSLRVIHSLGFAYRILDPSKVLITTPMPKCQPSQMVPAQYPRIRLNACGLFDIVAHDLEVQQGRASNLKEFYQQHQSDDLLAFGQLCLALATNSLNNAQRENWESALELVSRTYSPDLKGLIVSLLFIKQSAIRRTVNDITQMIGSRFYPQVNLAYEALDRVQADLEREALNGKLFRIIVKLSMINDRPELRLDPTWSETGDRYMLKLFREYLFHQVAEDGTPWLDCGHIVSTLIKFDAGSPEKICLISRDGQHVLVVSYGELKKCFESAFSELQH